jgi:pimeloyl-ACP methyl ester carboxylesterase
MNHLVRTVVLLLVAVSLCSAAEDPDTNRNITELIKAKGYPEEDHHAITPDGFILSIQRITGSRFTEGSPNSNKPVVLLQHGLLDNAISWVILETSESLGFILADQGYDVWLSNVRGNTYSSKHVSLKPNQDAFWAWSFDEMAKYDLPTVINYILNVTGQKTLSYVGHSQGTIMGFAGFEDAAVASKVNVFVALAPVAWVKHSKSKLLNVLAAFDVQELFVMFGVRDFMPDNALLEKLLPGLCKTTPALCDNFLGLICGWDTKNFNNTRLPVIVAHEPSGTSTQNIIHWTQLMKRDNFEKFDYGTAAKNLKAYNQTKPPQYPV